MQTTPHLNQRSSGETAGLGSTNHFDPLDAFNKTALYQDDAIKIQYDENLLHVQVLKFLPSQQFREAFSHLRGYEDRRLLLDGKGMKIVAPEDQTWLLNNSGLFSEVQGGRIAAVQPDDLFGKLSLKNILNNLTEKHSGLVVRVFAAAVDAKNWLRNVE